MRTELLTDYERGYLNGLFDGEGSITMNRDKMLRKGQSRRSAKRGWQADIRLSLSNTSTEMFDEVQSILGSDLKLTVTKPRESHHKTAYSIRYAHKVLRWLLPQMRFTVVEKERRRILAIEILKMIHTGTNQYTNTPTREAEFISLCDKWYNP